MVGLSPDRRCKGITAPEWFTSVFFLLNVSNDLFQPRVHTDASLLLFLRLELLTLRYLHSAKTAANIYETQGRTISYIARALHGYFLNG